MGLSEILPDDLGDDCRHKASGQGRWDFMQDGAQNQSLLGRPVTWTRRGKQGGLGRKEQVVDVEGRESIIPNRKLTYIGCDG
jgi:hypothetical protein